MMKIFFMLIFMMPLCFNMNMYWMVQMMLFFMMFLFLNLTISIEIYCNLSYMYSCDLLSYGLILLSIWIWYIT